MVAAQVIVTATIKPATRVLLIQEIRWIERVVGGSEYSTGRW